MGLCIPPVNVILVQSLIFISSSNKLLSSKQICCLHYIFLPPLPRFMDIVKKIPFPTNLINLTHGPVARGSNHAVIPCDVLVNL